jgi:hypothetical protein
VTRRTRTHALERGDHVAKVGAEPVALEDRDFLAMAERARDRDALVRGFGEALRVLGPDGGIVLGVGASDQRQRVGDMLPERRIGVGEPKRVERDTIVCTRSRASIAGSPVAIRGGFETSQVSRQDALQK